MGVGGAENDIVQVVAITETLLQALYHCQCHVVIDAAKVSGDENQCPGRIVSLGDDKGSRALASMDPLDNLVRASKSPHLYAKCRAGNIGAAAPDQIILRSLCMRH